MLNPAYDAATAQASSSAGAVFAAPSYRQPWHITAALLAFQALILAGCSDALPVLSELPKPPVPEILKPEKTIDQPKNLIERALSACPKRIETGETECLKTALVDQHPTIAELTSMIPGCAAGKSCQYEYTTIDRVGYVPATESNFVVHWRATFDFTRPAAGVKGIPIKVVTF